MSNPEAMWWTQFDPDEDVYTLYFGAGGHVVGTVLNGKDAEMIVEALNKSSALPNTKRYRWA